MNALWGLQSNVLNVIFESKDLLSIKNCKFYANLYKDIQNQYLEMFYHRMNKVYCSKFSMYIYMLL